MDGVGLIIPKSIYQPLWRHLLRNRRKVEEAAFCFGQVREQDGIYEVVDWRPVLAQEFAYQSAHHLELTDQVRADIVKQAHDMKASIVEFHSHVFGGPPSFSNSDLQGLAETAPHCLWRLKGRPYFAAVVSKGGFDGLAWFEKEGPVQLGWIRSCEVLLRASCETLTKV